MDPNRIFLENTRETDQELVAEHNVFQDSSIPDFTARNIIFDQCTSS